MDHATVAEPLRGLATTFLVAMTVGGILLGWLHNRGRPDRGGEASSDGWLGEDGAGHHGSWGDDDAGGHGGDGGH